MTRENGHNLEPLKQQLYFGSSRIACCGDSTGGMASANWPVLPDWLRMTIPADRVYGFSIPAETPGYHSSSTPSTGYGLTAAGAYLPGHGAADPQPALARIDSLGIQFATAPPSGTVVGKWGIRRARGGSASPLHPESPFYFSDDFRLRVHYEQLDNTITQINWRAQGGSDATQVVSGVPFGTSVTPRVAVASGDITARPGAGDTFDFLLQATSTYPVLGTQMDAYLIDCVKQTQPTGGGIYFLPNTVGSATAGGDSIINLLPSDHPDNTGAGQDLETYTDAQIEQAFLKPLGSDYEPTVIFIHFVNSHSSFSPSGYDAAVNSEDCIRVYNDAADRLHGLFPNALLAWVSPYTADGIQAGGRYDHYESWRVALYDFVRARGSMDCYVPAGEFWQYRYGRTAFWPNVTDAGADALREDGDAIHPAIGRGFSNAFGGWFWPHVQNWSSGAGQVGTDELAAAVLADPLAVAHRANTIDLIESLRPSHTGQTQGSVFYVSPTLGDTHANGARGGPDDPYSSLQDCHDNAVVSRRHDVIILVADNTSGITILDEQVTISKDYLSIRGPGRDFDIAYSSNGDTITITGDGVSLEKIQVNTHTSGNGRGIVVEDQDFVRLCNLWVNDTRGDGVSLTNCTNFIVEHCTFQDTGQSGAGEGLRVEADPSSTSSFGRIRSNYIDNVQGDGIFLDPTGSGEIVGTVIEGNRILECTSAGIRISGANVRDTVIAANNQFAGNATDVVDSGTDTTRETFFDPANDTVANVTLVGTTTEPSAASVASQVRTELTTELGRIDANTSSRATPADVGDSETAGGFTQSDRDQLETISTRTAGGMIVVNASPGAQDGGTITLVKGDDYSSAGDDADPVFTQTPSAGLGYTTTDIDSAAIEFIDEQTEVQLFTPASGVVEVSATMVAGQSVASLKFTATDITSANTDTLRRGANTASYFVRLTLNDGNIKTLARGDVNVD